MTPVHRETLGEVLEQLTHAVGMLTEVLRSDPPAPDLTISELNLIASRLEFSSDLLRGLERRTERTAPLPPPN